MTTPLSCSVHMAHSQHADFDYANYWEKERSVEYYRRLYADLWSEFESVAPVLDIGGGDGTLHELLGTKEVTIADVSRSGLARAKRRGYVTIKLDATQPFPSSLHGRFSTVFCFEFLEHVTETSLVLANIHAALKTGGVAFICIPNFPIDGVEHKRRWKWRELVFDCEKAGFAIVEDYSRARLELVPLGTSLTSIIFHIAFGRLSKKLRRFFPDALTSAYILKIKKLESLNSGGRER